MDKRLHDSHNVAKKITIEDFHFIEHYEEPVNELFGQMPGI